VGVEVLLLLALLLVLLLVLVGGEVRLSIIIIFLLSNASCLVVQRVAGLVALMVGVGVTGLCFSVEWRCEEEKGPTHT